MKKIIWIDVGTHFAQEHTSIFGSNIRFYLFVFKRFLGGKLLKRGKFVSFRELRVILESRTTIRKKSDNLIELPISNFLDKVATFLPEGIEIDSLYNKPQAFPLRLSMSRKLLKKNCFLVGEAIHSIHPVGGQGLNLCLRDVITLQSLITRFKQRKLNIDFLIC